MKRNQIHPADKIRLVCFDVDHTLLTDQQELTPKTAQTICDLQKQEIKVILATGKNLAAVQEIVDRFSLDDPLIFINGCLIQYRGGRVAYKRTLQPQYARQVLRLGDEQGLDMLLYFTNDVVVRAGGTFNNALDKYGGPSPRVVSDWEDLGDELDRILKISFIHAESHTPLEAMDIVLKHNIPDGIDTCFSLPILLEVHPAGVSKGTALREVANILNIPMQAILAFGDGNNDLEMLRYAGIGVALENATPELKNAANYVVPSNNEEGPARFLRDFFNLQ
jgi:hypothetical protein